MTFKKIYIGIILIGISLSSCTDNFDLNNPNEISVEQVESSLSGTQDVLNSVYNAMYNDYLLDIVPLTLCSDMGYPGYGRQEAPTNGKLSPFYFQTYTNSSDYITNNWAALYTGIFRANQVIEGLNALAKQNTSIAEGSEFKEQMGQARFFRGLFHYYLNLLYNNGDVIIFDFVPASDEDHRQSVSSSDSVKRFYRADLEYAYKNLPASWGQKDERVTAGTAATVLGQSYLYDDDFETSKKYLKDVISNNEYGYSLESEMSKMFTSEGEFNSESILEINYSLGIHPELTAWDQSAPTNELGVTSGTNLFTLPCWIEDLYQTEVMDTTDSRNYIEYTDADGKTKNDSLRTMPLRGSSMIATVQDDNTSWYLNPFTSASIKINWQSGLGYYRKYCNWDIIDDEKNLPDGKFKSGKNVIVYRLSDVYLMYAECMLRQSSPDVTAALKYMNLIRQRWGLQLLGRPEDNPELDQSKQYDNIIYTPETLFKQLQDIDRPLEMSAEGFGGRFFDLRRWNIMQQRFESLAATTYHLEGRSVPNPDNLSKPKQKWNVWVKKGEKTSDGQHEYNDFTIASQNFNDSKSYWPIPLLEEQNNPNLYKSYNK